MGHQDLMNASVAQNITPHSAAVPEMIFPISLVNEAGLSDDEHVLDIATRKHQNRVSRYHISRSLGRFLNAKR